MGFEVEDFEFFVEGFELVFEVEVVEGACGDSDVAARVEAPTLRGYLLYAGDAAEARDVGVASVGEEFLHTGGAAVCAFGRFAAIEAHDVGE